MPPYIVPSVFLMESFVWVAELCLARRSFFFMSILYRAAFEVGFSERCSLNLYSRDLLGHERVQVERPIQIVNWWQRFA